MKVIVSAGGTGGHIYPALAIIKKLQAKEKDLDIIYLGTHNRMEKEIIPSFNIPYEELEIYGFSKKNMFRNIKNIFLISRAYKKCLNIMKEFKPDIVIGVGGYVTFPVVKAAHKLNIKIFIHEQNSIPGKANLLISKYADLIGVSFEKTIDYFDKSKRVVLTGNPCGESALETKPMSKNSLGLHKDKKLVVIVSGSLGSQTINSKMKEFLNNSSHEKYEILYITGNGFYDEFMMNNSFPDNVKVLPFLNNLPALLKNTDLLVTRAGASTISEILALEIPSILIPSPYVANNHQYFNALEIQNNDAGIILTEEKLSSYSLRGEINKILYDQKRYQEIKNNLKKISGKKSSEIIYELIKEIIK